MRESVVVGKDWDSALTFVRAESRPPAHRARPARSCPVPDLSVPNRSQPFFRQLDAAADAVAAAVAPVAPDDPPGALAYVVDTSGSVGPEDFSEMARAAAAVHARVLAAAPGTRVAVLQFSSRPRVEVPLAWMDVEALAGALGAIVRGWGEVGAARGGARAATRGGAWRRAASRPTRLPPRRSPNPHILTCRNA